MSANEQPREKEIFEQALDLASPEARARFLDDACGNDAQLRERVEALLRASESAEDFLPDQPVDPPPAMIASVTEKPGDTIGRYKLLEKIGEGGMGVVYMAEQCEPVVRKVALKIIKLGMDTKQVIARFEAERQALAMMDHPHIAKIYDAGITEPPLPASGHPLPSSDEGRGQGEGSSSATRHTPLATHYGRPYFVMELVQGVPITEFCDQNQFSAEQRIKLFIPVCQAIQSAHQKGIIHRDLKPSNVLVTLNAGLPHPMVIDFGVAKATHQKLTEKTLFTNFATMIGTPAYMSPEQAEMSRLDVDTRSDIYSLGVLLYELLTGTTPFPEKRLRSVAYSEMQRIIVQEEPERPSTRLSKTLAAVAAIRRDSKSAIRNPKSEIDSDLDWIVMKCLEKDRNRRYETANGLAADILRHMSDEPVVARPPSTAYRFQKLVRRNKLAFAAGGAVAAALIIGLGISTWLFLKERESHRRADTAAGKSEQVAQFLKDVLEGVGPSKAKGRDTAMLKEILDKTADRVGKDWKNQPEVEAELRSILGEVYRALGDYEKAEEMQRKALDLWRQLFGNEHLAVAGSLTSLGLVVQSRQRPAEAEQLQREAVAVFTRLLGDEHVEVAKALNNLASALGDEGKLEEAERLHRRVVALRTRLLGPKHELLAGSLGNLGLVLQYQGRSADAEPLLREAVAMLTELLGRENELVATELNNLALALASQGKLEEAEKVHREVLKLRKKLLGNKHPDLAGTLHNLAWVRESRGDPNEAEGFCRQALAMQQELFGAEDSQVVASLGRLGILLQRLGKLEEAEASLRRAVTTWEKIHPGQEHQDVAAWLSTLGLVLQSRGQLNEAEYLQRQAVTMFTKLLGDEHLFVATSRTYLASALEDQGKLAESEQEQRATLALRRKLLPSEHLAVAGSLAGLTRVLCAEGKSVEAEPLARECLTIREKQLPDDWLTFNSRVLLGNSLLGQKRFVEAEPLLLSGYQGMKEREAKIPASSKARLKEALERLVQLYEAWGKPEQAAEWQTKLIEFKNASTEANSAAPAKP